MIFWGGIFVLVFGFAGLLAVRGLRETSASAEEWFSYLMLIGLTITGIGTVVLFGRAV